MIKNSGFFCENEDGISDKRPRRSTRQSLNGRFDKVFRNENEIYVKEDSCQMTQSFANWCDSFSSSLPNVNPRRALRNGAEKISQTINNVRTTIGTLSQKFRKSTRRRQPLKNVDSPKTPVTPYTRSKNMLGRTPTKLYSPFSIETPGKENVPKTRSSIKRTSPSRASRVSLKKKIKDKKRGGSFKQNNSGYYSPEMKFQKDLVQTQVGIYEFQSAANKIIQNSFEDEF